MRIHLPPYSEGVGFISLENLMEKKGRGSRECLPMTLNRAGGKVQIIIEKGPCGGQ